MKNSSSVKTRLSWCLVFFILYSQTLIAQTEPYPCAASEMQRALFDKNPALLQQQLELDQKLHEHLKRQSSFSELRSTAVFTIPVVVHVVHQNGAENISDAQVQAAIQHLNDAFAHQGYYANAGNGTPIPIQFCLAQRDPSNQATKGVTRDVSPLTNLSMEKDDGALKKISRWDAKQYLNIWVVSDINSTAYGAGVAGYAYYASAHGLSVDGIVCEARYFGNSPANDVVLIHEIGHYLNLYHTFEGGCSNNNCELEGDRVCDTPPDQAKHTGCLYNSCTTDADDTRAVNPLKTDGNDLTENYMDYSPFSCQHAFTPGQAARMLAALQTVRSSLLDSPGCSPPCTQNIVANISVPTQMTIGTPTTFTFSGSGATQFVWSLNGNSFSTQQNPIHTFTQVGNYKLEVVARNNDANCWARKEVSINVSCNVSADFSPRPTEVQLGDQLTFNSTGTGITTYEWSVEGNIVGTGKTYTHTFKSYGDYLLQLKVSNGNCSSTVTQRIAVQNPCGDFLQQYSYEYDLPFKGSFSKLAPNGDLMKVQSHGLDIDQTTIIMKWNANDELEWIKKETNPAWHVWDITPLSDGNWVYVKKNQAETRSIELVKINPQGEFIWSRRFKIDSSLSYDNHLITIDNGFLLSEFQNLTRFDNAGKVVWNKHLNNSRMLGAIQRTDGKILVLAVAHANALTLLTLLDDQGKVLKQVQLNTKGSLGSIHALSNNGGIIRVKEQNIIKLIKIDANLFPVWAKEFPNASGDMSLTISKNEDILLPLFEYNKIDALTLDRNGNYLWGLKFQGVRILGNPLGVPYLDGWKVFAYDLNIEAPARDFHLKIPNTQFPQGCYFSQAPPVTINNLNLVATESSHMLSDFSIQEISAPSIAYTNLQSTRQIECRIANPCPEICDNQIDDNDDGLTDCEDPNCKCLECQRLPDGVIGAVDSIHCQGDSIRVFLKICNQGQVALRAHTPIAFYATDPTLTNATPLAGVYTLGVDLPADTCISRSFVIRVPGSNPIFGMLNDNYQRARPYNLDRYQVEGTAECSYLNNKFQFNYNPGPVPQLDLGPDQLVCANSVSVLRITPGFARYRWFDGSTDSTFTAFSPGLYWVEAWDACGNVQSDTIRLGLQPLGVVDLGPNRSICAGDTVQLSVAGFAQVKWWPKQGLSCDTCHNIVLKPDTTTHYYVTVQQGNCFAGDSIRVVVNDGLKIKIELPDTLTCMQTQVQLKLDPTLPFPTKIEWQDANGRVLNGTNPTVTAAGWYILLVADSSGLCTTRDSVQVVQNAELPTLDLGADRTLCSDSSLQLLGPLLPNLKYQWSTGANTPSISVSQTGNYALEITNEAGCTARDSVRVTFSAKFTFDLGVDTTICAGEVLRLPTEGIDADFYRWSTGAQSAAIEVDKAGLYILEGIRDDCSWRDSIQVKLEDCSQFSVYVPNVMSPNSTVNQHFQPFFNQKTELLSYQFEIYDRWGEIIFRSVDRQESWDGTKKGERCAQGVYVWTLRVRYRENEREKEAFKVGEVLLLR